MSRREAGFTLVEILVGVFLVAVIGAIFLTLLQGSRSQVTLTGRTFAANHVARKVMDDLEEQARVNVTLLEMFQEYPDFLGPDRLGQGQSVYFRMVRDRKPPWGIVEPGVDGGLSPADGSFFRQIEPFTLTVRGRRLEPTSSADPGRHLAAVDVSLSWKESSGEERSYALTSNIVSPIGARPQSGLTLLAPAQVLPKARELLYPGRTGMSFAEAVRAGNGDVPLMEEIGRVAVITGLLETAISKTTQETNALVTRRETLRQQASPELPGVQVTIARHFEALASLLFNGLISLDDSMRKIARDFLIFKTQDVDYAVIQAVFGRYIAQARGIATLVTRAGQEYHWILSDALTALRPRRTEEFARMKTLETLRLNFVLDPAGFRAPYTSFLAAEKARMHGKNPFWNTLLLREERVSASPDTLKQAFANLAEISRQMDQAVLRHIPMAEQIITGRFEGRP